MWPQTLDMSRDECRGMLRRLELESYSHVVSVFRAQGALSESKAKLLEELRQLFHITQERHRAEVRRAANDEQLCTIAENVCGPNTWQEWSREGRRPYPLLPRINPQTALSIVANDLAAKVCAENAKLAAPAETSVHFGEALMEQASFVSLRHGRSSRSLEQATVVLDEPFKVPDVPNEVKKMTQKRKESESGVDGKPNKRRHMQQQQQQHPQQQPMQPMPQQSQSMNSAPEEGEAVPIEQRPSPRTMQQRFFYQQQMKHKQKLGSKRNLANSLATASLPGNPPGSRHSLSAAGGDTMPSKKIAAPAKSGRRAQKQHKLQQHQQQQQQPKVLLQSPETVHNHLVVQPHVEYVLDEALRTLAATTPPTSPYTWSTGPLVTLKPVKPLKPLVYGPQSGAGAGAEIGSPTTPGARGFANSPIVFKDKLQASPVQMAAQNQSSPVKKYIVEERQADASPTPTTTSISTANLPLAPQIISVQQIPAPPMGAKLRPGMPSPTNSTTPTILPPGTKITPKKINLLEGDAKPKTLPSSAVRLLPYAEPIGSPLSPLKDSRVSSASTVNIIKNIPASSLNNTLITPLPAGAATGMPANLFRAKVTTPQTKGAVGAGGSGGVTVIGAAGGAVSAVVGGAAGTGAIVASTAPQILGNIKLTTSTGGAATIKQVPSSALRNIKICSPNGKVFLQQGKLSAGSIIHKLNNASGGSPGGTGGTLGTGVVTSGTSNSTAVSPTNHPAREQRISIQKMQILQPAQGSGSAVGGGAGTGAGAGSGSPTTAISTKQTNLSGKPTTLTFATAGGGKNNLVFLPASAAGGMRAVTLATTKPKPSVVVIGATTSNSQAASSPNPNPSPSTGAKPKPNQLITEDTPIDIINMPIIVADNGTGTEVKPVSVKNAPLVVLNATDWEMELDQAATKAAVTPSKQALDDVIVEEDEGEEVDHRGEAEEHVSITELNNRIIELHPEEDDSAIEYVDMDLEQPIEIESTSNISPETTTTSLKAAIVSASAQQPQKKPLEQPLGAGAAAL